MSAGRSVADRLVVAPEVAAALAEGRPVVALESTLISHGLPYPQNLEVASASEAAVRETTGAVPATVAVRDGRVLVGLDRAALEALATAPKGSVRKAARPSLAVALAEEGWAATTVSATMIAAAAAGITVFATGGIGGVHRGALDASGGAPASLDISSDLEELGRTPMAVVCAGPKAILDVPATLEYLETRGVPVISLGQDEVAGFLRSLLGDQGSGRRGRYRCSRPHRRDASWDGAWEWRARVRALCRRRWHSPMTWPETRSPVPSRTPRRRGSSVLQ
jgi:pseudouridine-5'-phosphate glycosidase